MPPLLGMRSNCILRHLSNIVYDLTNNKDCECQLILIGATIKFKMLLVLSGCDFAKCGRVEVLCYTQSVFFNKMTNRSNNSSSEFVYKDYKCQIKSIAQLIRSKIVMVLQ
jgi:hypothetical protein